MANPVRESFVSQAEPEVLEKLRQIAKAQGREFEAVMDDALREYVERRQEDAGRKNVMDAFASSLEEFDSLYRELAK
jgi:predicted transcriptional regulator